MRLLFFLAFLFQILYVHSQTTSKYVIEESLAFSHHLINTDQLAEAEIFLEELNNFALLINHQDEIAYLKGWNFYKQKKLDLSATNLLKVSNESKYFNKSQFFAAYNNIYLNRLDTARFILNQNINLDTNLLKVKNFELAGIALLERDFSTFEALSSNFTFDYYPIARQEDKFLTYYNSMVTYKKKSKGLAAIYSTIIPGSGKVYAGKLGEGLSSFLIVSSLGLITAENYNKAGIKNAKTLLFGSMFTVFYLGNIWGSYFSVQIQNEEFNNELEHKILFDLHIPLRTIFN